jgi:iron complex transport system permease protein
MGLRIKPLRLIIIALTALCADVLAQLPGSQTVLPLNAVTALLGVPVIVWLILRRKNLAKTFGE